MVSNRYPRSATMSKAATTCTLCISIALLLTLSVNGLVPWSSSSLQKVQQHSHTKSSTFSICDSTITTKKGDIKRQTWKLAASQSPLADIPNGGSTSSSIAIAIDLPRVSITIGCTFFTWFLQKQYTNVMASSAITLICCMCLNKRLTQAAFCGTFAGMASSSIIPSWKYALGLGSFTSVLYEVLIDKKNAFVGVGGRLGATAFIASLLTASIQGTPTGLSLSSLAIDNIQTNVVLKMMLWHAVGSVGTIYLRQVGDDTTTKDAVRASAIVGLIGALFLQDKTAALALYGGSFVGMSAPARLLHGILPSQVLNNGKVVPMITRTGLFTAFAIAGALGGAIHGISIGFGWFNGGWGGKAGLCGFLGCLLYRSLISPLQK